MTLLRLPCYHSAMAAKLIALNISPGGMPKLPITSAFVSHDGVAGDWQRNRKYHGGIDRAICLYSHELYDRLRAMDIDLPSGSVGENFTTTGIDFDHLRPGDRLEVGRAVIEITGVRTPCGNLNKVHPKLLAAMEGHSGWLAKVVVEGDVRPGDEVSVVTRSS